mgnify:CR=1 FL=1
MNDYPQNYESWELDPSPRDALHLYNKAVPVDVTLAVSSTAENLFSIDTTRPSVNIVTNPSFETGAPPTGYTAGVLDGLTGTAGVTQSAIIAKDGTYSILVNPGNVSASEGFYWTTPTMGRNVSRNNFLVASIYLNDNAVSDPGVDERIVIADSSGVTITNGNTITLDTTWQRSSVSLSLQDREPTIYRIYVVTVTQHNVNFYADSLQVEILDHASNPTDYFDGSTAINCSWYGTAHASQSYRRKGLVQGRGYTLHTTGDIYFIEDQTASSSIGRYIRAGTDFWEDSIHIKNNISFINVNPGETPRVYGVIRGVHYGQLA